MTIIFVIVSIKRFVFRYQPMATIGSEKSHWSGKPRWPVTAQTVSKRERLWLDQIYGVIGRCRGVCGSIAAARFGSPIGGTFRARSCRPADNASKGPQALIASIKVPVPSILITRLRLYARTCRLISVLTFFSVLVRKCTLPIHSLIVPNGCSTV